MLTTTVCAALSAAGLAIAFLTAWRRRFVRATKIAAVALLPIGLALAGLIDLGGTVGTAVGRWARDLVLDPGVWTGFAVLAVAVVLYVVARVASGRGGGREARPSRKERRAAAAREGKPAAEGSASKPALGRPAEPAKPAAGKAPPASNDDFSDIEAILKKHGI